MEVDPEHFEDGASDNNGVKSVEGRVEESHRTQGIHSNQHFKDEGTQKHEFHINWKISQKINKLGIEEEQLLIRTLIMIHLQRNSVSHFG